MKASYTTTVALLITLFLNTTHAAATSSEDRLRPAWEQLDKNGDGNVALEELHPYQARVMSAHDADGDGNISLGEYVSYDLDPGASGRIPIPDSVRLIADIPYAGTADERQRLDIYLPAAAESGEPLPVIAYVHGGGWAVGSKISARSQLLPLVETGQFAGVSIGYRLSWQANWPAQLHDTKAAIRWIRAHASDYNLDSERICAFGPSAGGHLAAMLGTTSNDDSMAGRIGTYAGLSSAVHCAVDFFGPADLRDAEALGPLGKPSMVTKLLGGSAGDNQTLAASASPLLHADASDVPFLIVHGTRDPLVDYRESVALADALRDTGVEVYFQTVEGGGHGNFGAARDAVDARVRRFLEKVLYDAAVSVPVDTLYAKPGTD